MSYFRQAVGLMLSLGLLSLLLLTTDLSGLLESLRSANYAVLLPAIVIYFAGVWLRGIRWKLLLLPVATLPTARLFRGIVIGFTVNDILPMRVGELARAALLARWARVPIGATLGSIVVERLFDGLTLCAILALVWLWFPLGDWLEGVAKLAALVFISGAAGALAMTVFPRQLTSMVRMVIRPLPERPRTRILELLATFLQGLVILQRGRTLPLIVLLSLGAWAADATMYYLIMLGFGIGVGPVAALLSMVAGNFGTMVPSSPGYVGTFHLPVRLVLTERFGVEVSLATSYTLVVHAALIVPVVALGILLLSREGLSLGDLTRRLRDRPQAVGRSTDPVTRTL